MNDFQGLLSGDYGFKPQGKSAPMVPTSSNTSTAGSAFDFDNGGSTAAKTAPYSKPSISRVFLDNDDDIFPPSNSGSKRKTNGFGNLGGLDHVLGGSSKSTGNHSVNFDSIFGGVGDSESKSSSLPVFDKPVYDDEESDGVSGLKSSSSTKYEDIFASSTSPSLKQHDAFDDILGDLGREKPESKGLSGVRRNNGKDVPAFDDLLPGFGPSRTPSNRHASDNGWDRKTTVSETTKGTGTVEDPFVVLNSNSPDAPSSPGHSSDPLEQFSKVSTSSTKNSESVSASGGIYDDTDSLGSLGDFVPVSDREKVGSPLRTGPRVNGRQTSASVETRDRSSSLRSPERFPLKKMLREECQESARFDTSSVSVDCHRSAANTSSFSYVNASDETTSQRHTPSLHVDNVDSSGDVWLTVSEIPLFTQPTAASPPSRPPPPRPPGVSKGGAGSVAPRYAKKKPDDYPSFPNSAKFFQSSSMAPVGVKNSFASPIDELENFAMGRTRSVLDGNSDVPSGEDLETNSEAAASAAAMKEAVDRAEARFKHAKEVRERENAKAARMQQEDKSMPELQEREYRGRHERQEPEWHLREEEERIRREREEREKEQRRLERERIERERVRQAVERATREARERAAVDARAKAEKAAVHKVQAEARERAARAAAEAKQRADKEKAEREAREKAEREAKEKEACNRAAAASARTNQQKNDNDLESFSMGSRSSSVPRPGASSSDPLFDQFLNKQAEVMRTSVASAASMRKASSSTNFFDDLNLVLGDASSGEFQEVEGETEERRRARMERNRRTQERAAKALAEKNQRDLEAQREQAERHRIAETLDIEIKRWAAGKEGNLRALLSTLQYVLWPECGWQPVSLTDLITAVAVKKVYRKATLCIHPDKVQQKGATLQQKYIAEKVFDLLKESWNKFNSEELF